MGEIRTARPGHDYLKKIRIKTMEEKEFTIPSREEVKLRRLQRRLDIRDRKIEGLKRKVARLERALAWRTVDLETLTRNLGETVQQALCNVRMIPVGGLTRNGRILGIQELPPVPKEGLEGATLSPGVFPADQPAHKTV